MKAKSNQLTVESMTQRYSLGHKALSVALSVVLMGFGWPAVSPSQVYAGDGAAADDAAAQVEGASSAAATSTADKAADTAASSAASAASSAAPAASEQPASTTSQQQAAPSASEPAQPAATQQDESAKEDAGTADVELVLGNASIAYMNQVVSAPAHKLTVPVNDDFKFTVSPDNGYSLTKAVLKVSGKENPISPDDQGVYTVSAADVAAGATVTLETEAVSSDSGKDNAAVSIEDDATEKTQASVSGAGAISGPTSIAQGDEVTLADSTKKLAATSLSISGSDTVEQFKSITLKTNAGKDVTWTSSDPSVATIDASGKVVGVKAGRVTITATTVTAEGKVLTATYELTVAESKASATNCYLFFQNSPTANPDSNGTASWFPSGGKHALGVKVNLDGLNLPGGKNSYDNVANRVTQWPDGSTGSSWVLDRNGAYSQYWNAVFRAWKDTLSKEQGTQITEDDVEEIALYPYKISNNTNVGCGYHLDCKVVVKCNKAINAVFYLQDADASGFAQYDAATYKLEKGIAQVAAPSKTPADEKTVNGVKYKFMGWCSDQACTQAVSFPMRTSENVNYYGKYVACDQSIQVNYYLEGTTTQVAPSKTLSGYMKGQTVVQSPISIEGYKPVSDETKSGVVGNDSSIDFYYTANPVDYSIEYYWTGSDTPISSEKRSGHVGDQVTGLAPKAIAGYAPVSDNVQDLKLGADESQNVVKFYYRQNVSLKANSDSKTYNGSEQSVDGYTTNLPEGVSASFDGVTLEGGKGTNAGDYPYTFANGTIGKVGSDNNYVVTQTTPGNLHIGPVTDKVTVTITGNSATLQYSGSEQSVTGYSFATSDNRYREANVKFQGEAVAKGTNAGTYNMNLASGQFSNTSGNFTNVEFVVVDGSLEITGGDLDAGKVVWDVHDVQKVYDGTPLSAYVAKATDKFGNALKVEYSTDGKQWTDDPSSITLTHFGAQLVMLRATGANYAADQYAENGEWVAITSRPVKLTSKGDNKKYDGKPLTNDTVTVETKGEGTGFIDGEGVTIKVTGSQTDAGYSDNTFEYNFNEGTNANDYWVKTELGKLVVTASDSEVVATIAGHNKSVEYNGLEQSVEGYDFVEASNKLYGEGDFAFSGTAVAKGTDVGTYKMNLASEQFANTSKNFSKVTFAVTDGTLTITPKSIVPDPENPKNTMSVDSPADVVYNGQDQTWTPVVKDGERTLEPGKDYTVEYSTAERTNATGKITVTIKGINNYSGEVKRTYQIAQRPVELKSEGGSKPYDGTALVKPEVSGWQQQGDTGFVTGEVSNVRATGSVTTVAQGEVTNSIAYDTNAGFNANNYDISKDEGKLSITALAAEDDITITPNNATYIYDASSHEAGAATASASVAGTDVNLEYRVKGSADTEWRSNASAITAINAGALTVEVRASAANYSGYKYAEQTLTIQKRDVELTSASASKVYDGAPLTKNWVDMGPNRPDTGFIWTDLAGDGQVHATGSQTKVGSSENAISYQLKPGAENNYNIIGEHVGTLTVTAQSIAPDPQNPDSYKGVAIDEPNDHVYDGTEHKWAPEVTDKDGNKLVKDRDYTVTYDTDDFVNVKVVNVTIAGMGSYTGTCVKAYEITKAPLTVNAGSASKVYDGEALTAGATIEGLVGGENATAQTQGSQTEVGSSANTVLSDIMWDTAKEGNYYIAAQNDGTLTVTPKGIAQMTVSSLPDVIYNGESQQQKPVVKDGEKVLAEGVDYELTYSGNTTDAGTVTVTVTGKGNYAGSVDVTYRIAPAPLAVTTLSASGVYNGKPLTAAGSVSGFVNGESAPFETTGSQTEVGTSDNTYAIDWAAADATAKQANYTVSETVGKLTVTEFAGRVVATPGSYSGVYDGQAHGVDVTVAGLPEGYSVKAARSDAAATDATDEAGVTASVDELVIVNAQGEDVTGKLDIEKQTGAIKIAPAEYHVVTEGAFKVYDGTALTAPGKIVGLVNGEEASLSVTGSQTDAGSSANTYAIAFDKSAKEGNYVHGADTIGSLEVTAAKAEGKISLSGSSASKVYDGKPLAAKAATATVPTQDAVTIEYSLDGESWTTDPGSLTATDVADSATVQLRASSPGNYEGYVYGSQQLSVTKRAVSLKSESASKVFDGTALTRPEVAGWKQLGDEGFVDGQVSDVRATGSATHVSDGKVANAIAYTEGEGFNTDNYAISKDEGALSVTAKQIAAADMTVQAPADVVYSGKAQQQKPVVKDGDKALAEGVDYELTYSGNATDAGTVTVTVTGKGDYAGSVDVAYQITPAPLTVVTESANKVYDGKPLTAGGKVDGLVNGETVEFKLVGSQIKVGSSDNAYKIEWNGTAKRANYRLEAESIGKLTVTESADQVVVTTAGGTFTYDGSAHGAAVTVGALPEGYTLEAAASSATATNVSDGEVAATADALVIKNAQGEDVTSKLNVKFVDGAIKVEPAKLTVTTPSASKPYDGNALMAEGKASGFVNGEAATLKTTGSQATVGTSENGYELVWDGSAKAANYTVEENLGTLTVSAQSIDPDDAGAFGGVTVGYLTDTVYNGADQRFEPEVVDKDGKALVKGRDYELSFSGDVKNVGEVTVTVIGKGNYAGGVERTYRIAPAPLTVTTGSDSKIYDGSELVNNELSIEGLQGEDRVTAATTGSQTEVGSSENAYRITWGDVDAANYVIDEHLGTLTVMPAPVPPTPTPAPTPTPTPTPTPDNGSTPGANPDGSTTPAPASAAAGPLDALAGVLEDAYESVTGGPEADNPVEEERIYDAENPLGRESVEDHCWVHWYMIVGMVLTAVYGLAAALRRKNHEHKLRNDMNDVLGDGDGKDPSGSPAARPAGMEA